MKCADVSFHMNLFRVIFRWYFITQNAISFLSKWKQWNNTHNEFYFGLYDANRNWSDTEMKIFHFTRNKISCKHIFRSEIYWTVKIIWWIKWTFLSVIKLNKLRLSNPSQIKKKNSKNTRTWSVYFTSQYNSLIISNKCSKNFL